MKNKKQILILGGGTAGTVMANQLYSEINEKVWVINVVDEREKHFYQPGFLFLPFGMYEENDIVRPIRKYLPDGVGLVQQSVKEIIPEDNKVILGDGNEIAYNILSSLPVRKSILVKYMA